MANPDDDSNIIEASTPKNTKNVENSKEEKSEVKIPISVVYNKPNSAVQISPSNDTQKFVVEKIEEITPNGKLKSVRTLSHPSDDLEENISIYGDYDTSALPDNDIQSAFSAEGVCGETIVDHLPVAPDGGYGWVIVGAAFVSNLIVDGICNSFAPFMSSYQKTFDSTKAATSFIGSLLIGAYLLSGPIAGGLINKYESKNVVIGGTILVSISFILSTFSPNIIVHYITFGLFGGIGFGFIYLPAIVVVSQYFEKKRALATGIAVSGSGIGTFIMPFLCKFLIEEFNWKITLYVLSVLVLVCAVCGWLYKPLLVPEDEILNIDKMKQQPFITALHRADFSDNHENQSCVYDEEEAALELNCTNLQCTNRMTTERENGQYNSQNSEHGDPENETFPSTTPPTRTQLSPITENKSLAKSRTGSHVHNYNFVNEPLSNRIHAINRNRKTTLTSINSEFTSIANGIDIRHSRTNLTNQLSRISARSYAQSLSRLSQTPLSIKGGESVISIALSGVDPKEFNRPLSRRDIFLQGSIKNLKEFEEDGCNYKVYREQHSISIPASVLAQSMTKLNGPGGETVSNIAELSSRMGGSAYSKYTGGFSVDKEELAIIVDDNSKFKFIPFPIRNAFSEMIDLKLLSEPIMLILCFSNILGMVGFYVPFVFVIDLAVEKGINVSQGTLLLSIIGITNTIGRVFFGWIADRQWISALMLNNWSLILCGLLTCICPLAPNFPWLIVYASLFGFFVSAYICLTSIVLSDLLGVERLTNSFGLLVVSRGIASLIGTPLAGIVYDYKKSYNASFYFSGALITLSGAVSCVVPFLHRYERSKLKNEGDYLYINKDEAEAQSGKLSVLTEHSEENLTEYQRTLDSCTQQKQFIQELEEYKRKVKNNNGKLEEHKKVSTESIATPSYNKNEC